MDFNFELFKKTFFLFSPYQGLKKTGQRWRFIFATFLILVDVAAASLVPYYTKTIVDSLAMNVLNSVWIALFFLGFFWILEKTLNHIQEILFFPIINNTIRDLYYKVVEHTHEISFKDYQKLSIPELINCTRRISLSARSFFNVLFLMIVPTIIKLIVAIAVVTQLGFFGFGLLPAIVLAALILNKGIRWYIKAREAAWSTTDTVLMRINDSLLNTKIARFFPQYEMEKIKTLVDNEAELWYKTNTRLQSIYICFGTWLGLTITALLSVAVLGIQQKTLSVGDFVLLKGQLIAAFLPFKLLAVECRQLAESLVDIKKIIQFFEIPKQQNSTIAEPLPSKSCPALALKNITFSHDENTALFERLNLEIAQGEKIAIYGESSCGKSTLLSLMCTLYQPHEGRLLLQGQDAHCIPKSVLKKMIHCIPQDLRLFNLSLYDNLTYGLSAVPLNLILKAAQLTGLIELIEKMPLGLETLVGEMGTKLSGGEKQKVALTRALLLKPDILLLDETTNSLNVESESQILEAIFSTIPTVIIATHRSSTLEQVDKILKLENGLLLNHKLSPAFV